MLRHVPGVDDPRVLIDAATRDDAAVFRLADDRALVATVDFFTPIVDDPYAFGAVAAANAFSDVYAMGGTPLLALNLVAWPRDPDILALLPDTIRGAAAVAREAAAVVVGGHSIDDREPKFGLAVIGEVHPDRVIRLAGAEPGDALVLTKPVGTGILATALKRDLIDEAAMAPAVESMVRLNRDARDAIVGIRDRIRACTDVTGFGLLGHLHNMLRASGRAARLRADAVPELPGARTLAAAGAIPGGTTRNLAAADAYVTWPDTLPSERRALLADAQTSGGLLVAVAPSGAAALVDALERRGVLAASVGEVVDGPAGHVTVV